MTIAMGIFAVLTLLSAAGVIFAAKPLNSALFLVNTLFLVAVHFALLGAHFVATLQVLVYTGAIMVLVIFVIMLLGLEGDDAERRGKVTTLISAISCAVFAGVLGTAIWKSPKSAAGTPMLPEAFGSPAEIGQLLFTKYLYPFEITSLLLLGGIIGAVVLAQDKKRPLAKDRGLRAKQIDQIEEKQVGNY